MSTAAQPSDLSTSVREGNDENMDLKKSGGTDWRPQVISFQHLPPAPRQGILLQFFRCQRRIMLRCGNKKIGSHYRCVRRDKESNVGCPVDDKALSNKPSADIQQALVGSILASRYDIRIGG